MPEKNEALNSCMQNLHTTEMGAARIKRNLSLETDDSVGWCRQKMQSPEAVFVRKGKNWYISVEGVVITVNAYSNTIITAHKQK